MLAKFKVSNFKSFDQEFVFDLEQTNKYEFNDESVSNGIVKNALIYGHNGVGKSNLGLGIFDITHHLTDYMKKEDLYSNYLNAESKNELANFYYKFKFGDNFVEYRYSKNVKNITLQENLKINNKTVASIDRLESITAEINLDGTEFLNKQISNSNLSLLKYIRNNSQLSTTLENDLLSSFYEFVDGMLFFRSLNRNMYIGFESGSTGIEADIIKNNNVQKLEEFLNKGGIDCKLSYFEDSDKETIYFDFKDRSIPFYEVASTGTKSLILYFFWLQRIKKSNSRTKFLFIDEFDAFYHHRLSQAIIEELKDTNVQFILTTHNTSNITNEILRPDCYFLMYKDRINSLSNLTVKELRQAHNIEKMYKAGAFDEI